MTPISQLTAEQKLVLRIVAERDMDGYSLAKHSSLSPAQLERTVQELASLGLLRIKGSTGGMAVMEAWFQAAPGVQKYLAFA